MSTEDHEARREAALAHQRIDSHEAFCGERWKQTDIYSVIKSGRAYVLMAQMALSSFQKKLAEEFGVRPGEEMHRAMEVSHDTDTELSLVDREVRITLKRAWANAGFWSLIKIMAFSF